MYLVAKHLYFFTFSVIAFIAVIIYLLHDLIFHKLHEYYMPVSRRLTCIYLLHEDCYRKPNDVRSLDNSMCIGRLVLTTFCIDLVPEYTPTSVPINNLTSYPSPAPSTVRLKEWLESLRQDCGYGSATRWFDGLVVLEKANKTCQKWKERIFYMEEDLQFPTMGLQPTREHRSTRQTVASSTKHLG